VCLLTVARAQFTVRVWVDYDPDYDSQDMDTHLVVGAGTLHVHNFRGQLWTTSRD
jgi:hypothetical protein